MPSQAAADSRRFRKEDMSEERQCVSDLRRLPASIIRCGEGWDHGGEMSASGRSHFRLVVLWNRDKIKPEVWYLELWKRVHGRDYERLGLLLDFLRCVLPDGAVASSFIRVVPTS
jgi:hypothetical protein